MLTIEKLTYRVGGRVLFEDADAAIGPGHRVGFVGRNGTGKTTLLRMLAGELEPQGGRIGSPARWHVGMTRQEAPAGPESLIETVLAADTELAQLTAEAETATEPHRLAEIHARLHDKDVYSAPARAARLLAGLGFSEAAQQRPCREYSGGWRMRVALAALLFTQPDLLLLDEPTNHLDLEATLWLQDYLRTYPGTILLVSHDRDLLNVVPEEILHLEAAKLTLYQGNYDRFEATRRARLEQDEKQRTRIEGERARIRAFVDRFRYKASKAKQAQSRLKMLERLQPIAAHREEGASRFEFPAPEPLASPLYSLEKVTLGYDDLAVLSGLNLRLDQDDRIALLGANGNGKSTLIKCLAGRLNPLEGRVVKSGKLQVGYFAQHQQDELDLTATPIVELGRKRRQASEQQVRSHLGRFGFSQERAETPIGSLSGGEKARLLFALMSCNAPHILLLDEPTNHLDVSAREALVQAINDFPGAVILVSHDSHLIELTADRFWLVADGRVQPFDGDLADYRALTLGRGGGKDRERAANGGDGTASGPALDKKQQRRQAAERRDALAPLKKKLRAAETEVHRLEKEKAKVQAALADPVLYQQDGREVTRLTTSLGGLEKELAAAEETWMALQEEWDQAEAGLP